MKKAIGSIIMAVFLVFPLASAFANSFHDSADSDKNGVVTREEMKKAVEERFREGDTDKDGKWTIDEYRAARQKAFSDADTGKDGVVTVEEWAIYWCGTDKDPGKVKKPVKMGKKNARTEFMDANKDGKVGRDECVLFWSGRFTDIDGNNDGKLSREEYRDRMMELAKSMDIDGDGVITIEEYLISWLIEDEDNSKNAKKPVTKQKKPERKKAPSAG